VRGEYGVEAVFTEEAGAQTYADRYNLDLIRKGAEPATVEAVDFYGSGVVRRHRDWPDTEIGPTPTSTAVSSGWVR
jgi:hypothetical protein